MPTQLAAKIASIYRYPIKGLSPEKMASVLLEAGQTLPADRRYAIENGPSGFDATDPKYFSKIYFLMLMRNERLAALHTHFDDANHTLTIRRNNSVAAQGNLETEAGRSAIEQFFQSNFATELKGAPKIISGGEHSFSDVSAKVVSIVNLASVAAIEDTAGQPVDPLRFRANLYVSGWPGWHEFSLVGSTLSIGKARLRVVKNIVRCAAINVDPVTAERDMNLPQILIRNFGHDDCGIYAEVIAGGDIAQGDAVTLAEPQLI